MGGGERKDSAESKQERSSAEVVVVANELLCSQSKSVNSLSNLLASRVRVMVQTVWKVIEERIRQVNVLSEY